PDKLFTLVEECGLLLSRARREDGERFAVMPAWAHLAGEPEQRAINLLSTDGRGLFCVPSGWSIARDDAAAEPEKIAAGERPWSLLSWVPLMAGADSDIIVARWSEVLEAVVADDRFRRAVRAVALTMSQLALNRPTWARGLKEESIMGESLIFNQMRKVIAEQERVTAKRKWLADLLEGRFPGQTPEEIKRLIREQESEQMLDLWFATLTRAGTYGEFDAVVRQ
ncbi:MAG: hypothetical protein K2W96_26970, partial [Gemmataceae bacterium]|nr:hypothetical protein [Gemmataceae bacterium]